MPGDFEQYAVYWVPKRNDPLARFGASWTGWCAERGARRPRTVFHGHSIDLPKITRKIWRHGFHSVIKAPFGLRPNLGRFTIEHVLGRLSEDSASFPLPRLQLEVVQGYVVLASTESCPALGDLIARVGKAMAQFEAPPLADDGALAQKSAPGDGASAPTDSVVRFPTSSAQSFQIPLTDRLDPEIAQEVMEVLQPMLEAKLDHARWLHDMALMGDPGSGRPLRVLEFYELSDLQRQCKSGAMPVQGPVILVPMPRSRTSKPGVSI